MIEVPREQQRVGPKTVAVWVANLLGNGWKREEIDPAWITRARSGVERWQTHERREVNKHAAC